MYTEKMIGSRITLYFMKTQRPHMVSSHIDWWGSIYKHLKTWVTLEKVLDSVTWVCDPSGSIKVGPEGLKEDQD